MYLSFFFPSPHMNHTQAIYVIHGRFARHAGLTRLDSICTRTNQLTSRRCTMTPKIKTFQRDDRKERLYQHENLDHEGAHCPSHQGVKKKALPPWPCTDRVCKTSPIRCCHLECLQHLTKNTITINKRLLPMHSQPPKAHQRSCPDNRRTAARIRIRQQP